MNTIQVPCGLGNFSVDPRWSKILSAHHVSLSFCSSSLISQFFHKIPLISLLCCTLTFISNIIRVLADVFLSDLYFLLTTLSFGFIIASILLICSVEGKMPILYLFCSPSSSHPVFFHSIYIYVQPTVRSAWLLEKAKMI